MKPVPVKLAETQIVLQATKEQLAGQTATFFQKGLEGATNSRLAYQSDLQHVGEWLSRHELTPLPMSPATLATYLSDLATRHKWATIARRLATLRKWHRLNNHTDPAKDEGVAIVVEGIKRSIGTQPQQAPVFPIDDYKAVIGAIPVVGHRVIAFSGHQVPLFSVL